MADIYNMNGSKVLHHLDRVLAWKEGKRIPPVHIDVGLSKGCNIHCNYCYGITQANEFKKGAKKWFPEDRLLAYMRDAAKAGVRSMALVGEAEPTLNPAVYDAIIAGKTNGADMAMATNGILYDDGAKGQAALEYLTWLRFNISAASDSAYRRIHASKEFDTACRKIAFTVEQKRKKKLDVTIGLQMVLTPDNVGEAVPLAKLGRELGVDYLVIKQCGDTVSNKLGIYDRLSEYSAFDDLLMEAESLSTPGYDIIVKWQKIQSAGKRSYDACLGAPFLLYSSGDGKLYPCGMFFDWRSDEFLMGDLCEQSFGDILASDRYWQVIDKVAKTMDVHKECYANCRTNEINNILWQLTHPPKHVNFI
ncbi:MAG: radical SAM protein [Alphaproteobacteria bacterium]|nr:radical SAM protein [Alphaproteobacteria bacterium]